MFVIRRVASDVRTRETIASFRTRLEEIEDVAMKARRIASGRAARQERDEQREAEEAPRGPHAPPAFIPGETAAQLRARLRGHPANRERETG